MPFEILIVSVDFNELQSSRDAGMSVLVSVLLPKTNFLFLDVKV